MNDQDLRGKILPRGGSAHLQRLLRHRVTYMLTKKGKYGLKALVDLARLQPGETAFINDVASRNNIPKKFLDTILLELRNAGMLRSKKGPGGGYSLSRPASEIRIGHVIRTLDGPLAPIRCASRTAYEACDDCADPESCQVRRSMTEVRDAIATILDGMTLEAFVAGGGIEIEEQDDPMLSKSA